MERSSKIITEPRSPKQNRIRSTYLVSGLRQANGASMLRTIELFWLSILILNECLYAICRLKDNCVIDVNEITGRATIVFCDAPRSRDAAHRPTSAGKCWSC